MFMMKAVRDACRMISEEGQIWMREEDFSEMVREVKFMREMGKLTMKCDDDVETGGT